MCQNWSGKGIHAVSTGFSDNPYRLVESLGLERTSDILNYAAGAATILREANCLRGSLVLLAEHEAERAELQSSFDYLTRMNKPAKWIEQQKCMDSIGNFYGGLIMADTGIADVHTYANHCLATAIDNGLKIAVGELCRGTH